MRRASLAGLLITALVAGGCLLEVEKVQDPRPAFAQARAELARVQGRPGRPGSLEVLVYDRAEGQLVRASLPMWLVHKIGEGEDVDLDLGADGSKAVRRVKSRLRLEDVEKAGRGALVEVEEEDGDQVLVWLR